MSDQDNGQVSTIQRPTTNDPKDWEAYWQQQGQPWRTEPEIDVERQKYLTQCRAIVPDVEKGIYPFKDVDPKLTRADIEWLILTQPLEGLDLRGADLRGLDLHKLPLPHLRVGLTHDELVRSTWGQGPFVAACLDEADLREAHLEEASFEGVSMERATLQGAFLRKAILTGANLKEAMLSGARMEEASFGWADLRGTDLQDAHMQEASFDGVDLREADLSGAHLENADLSDAHLEHTFMYGTHLESAYLANSYFAGAYFGTTYLAGADLSDVNLVDEKGVGPQLSDIYWGDANLTVVDWSQVRILAEEREARDRLDRDEIKDKGRRVRDYKAAARAYQQLAVALKAQGLAEAATFAYRERLMQRAVFRLQRKIWQYLGSLFLDLTTGYGYRVWRSFVTYIFVIMGFATIFFFLGPKAGVPLSYGEAIVFSMTSFHGRGFSPGENIGLSNPVTVFAAFEAFVGLIIEITFIATLTQRLFGK